MIFVANQTLLALSNTISVKGHELDNSIRSKFIIVYTCFASYSGFFCHGTWAFAGGHSKLPNGIIISTDP